MVTESDLKYAYDLVLAATKQTQLLGVIYEKAKEELEVNVLKATSDGRVVGSNDGARKAAALVLFEKEYADRDQKESDFKVNMNELTLARIHLDFIRDCIRLEELLK
jgi:predicted TIM-barrel fold metal-dependent hydrolase